MRCLTLPCLLMLVTTSLGQRCKGGDTKIKNYRIKQSPSDTRPRVTLVGLFPLHKGPNCDEVVSVKNYNGYQRMEAFVWALARVNDKMKYDSPVFIETMLYDTCSDSLAEHPIRALMEANKTVEKEISQDSRTNLIIGVVGASYSSVTKPLSRATLAMNLPLVSYAASNPDLSKYKMFARTVWSDDILAETITDIIYEFNLTSAKTIGTKDKGNSKSLEKKIQEIKEGRRGDRKPFDLCERIEFPPKTSPEFGHLTNHTLKSSVDAFVVAIQADTKRPYIAKLRTLMKANEKSDSRKETLFRPLNSRRLQLISTDTWDISDPIPNPEDLVSVLQNSITIVEDSDEQSKKELRKHLELILNRHRDDLSKAPNPWAQEFLPLMTNCFGKNFNKCAPRLLTEDNVKVDSKVENVMNTVALFAATFRSYYRSSLEGTCSEKGDGCLQRHYDGQTFFRDFIVNQKNIPALVGRNNISLDCYGDSNPMYAIYQLQTDLLKYEKIGTWRFNSSQRPKSLVFENDATNLASLPNPIGTKKGTRCKPECPEGQKKVSLLRTGPESLVDGCCHSCERLDANEIFQDGRTENCPKGQWPDEERAHCRDIWEQDQIPNYDSRSTWAVFVTFVCSVCMIIIVSFAVFFFVFRDHEAVTKSGIHYFPFIFGGAFLSQVVGLAFMNSSLTPASCTWLQFITGLAPTLMFSAIVVKNRKVYQIFIGTFEKQQDERVTSVIDSQMINLCPTFIEERLEKIMRPKTRQIVSILVMIVIQTTIISGWKIHQLVVGDSGIVDEYPAGRHIRICSADINEFLIVQAFNLVLIILCTIYGYMTRHVRSDFNETKYISISMFTVTLIWLCAAFIISAAMETGTYTLHSDPGEPELRVAVLSMVLSFSGLAVIVIMFTNKVYNVVKTRLKTEYQPASQKT